MKSDEATEKPKATVGEELYLVHLRRHEGEEPREEDFDRGGTPRKRSASVGEELWDVHLKRSRGMEPDVDEEKETTEETSKEEPKEASRYYLRNRGKKQAHKAK